MTSSVQLAGHGVHARAAFRGEKHARIERGGPANELPDARYRGRVTNELEGLGGWPLEAGGPSASQHQFVCHNHYYLSRCEFLPARVRGSSAL